MGNYNTKDEVREAYEYWQKQRNEWGGLCCNKSHFYMDDLGRYIWKLDNDVCKREKAWRDYVRVRDCNPNFPFGSRDFFN